MSKRDVKKLGNYIRAIADQMGLREWHLVLNAHQLKRGQAHQAEIEVVDGRRYATFEFREDFRAMSAEMQRELVVHELVHCLVSPMSEQVRNDLETLLGTPADTAFWLSFKRNMELSVDAIAKGWAPHLPLINWEGK